MTTIPVGALVRDRELPELGPGRIVAELKGGASRIVFEHQDEIRDVDLKRVDVVRLPLIPGTEVQVRSGRFGDESTEPGRVLDAELPDSAAELCDYIVDVEDGERTVSEAELFPQGPETTAPLDQFDSLFWRGPFRFFARWGMHRTVSRLYEDSEGLPSLIGARIEPQAHLIRTVRRVLWAEKPGFVLADPSHSDRLVEAGLVVQAAVARDPDARVLVVSPGMRTSEWKSELELRFGGRTYERLTESTVAGLEFHQLAGVFQEQRMVVSYDLVANNRDARTMLAGEDWDVVVFADAHRLQPGESTHEFARELAARTEMVLALSPMPQAPEAEELAGLFSLVRPEEYDPDDSDELESYIEERAPVWEALRRSLEEVRGELDDETMEDLADAWRGVEGIDPSIERFASELAEGEEEALEKLMAYVQSYYGFAEIAVRTPRSALAEVGTEWPERELERLDYEPEESEVALSEHLAAFPEADESGEAQRALRALYHRRFWETPERFLSLLHDRGGALESLGDEEGDGPDLLGRLALAPDPLEAEAVWNRIVRQAPPFPDEKEWIGRALKLAQDWQNDVGRVPRRFESAAEWIEAHLEEDDERKVLVVSQSRRSGEAFHGHLTATLGEGAVELYHGELPESLRDDAMGRFQDDPDCRAVVVDELAGEGRRVDHASALVHLDVAWSPSRLDARIGRLDRASREDDVRSVVPVGPDGVEREMVDLYEDVLGIYESQPGPEAWRFPSLERELLEAIGAEGAEGVGGLAETWRERVESTGEAGSQAYQASIDPRPSQLEDVQDFAELLDFVDGIDDPLPVRHWARMIGIDDHRVRPGVYDFKWHWSSVRRELAGFEMPEGEDPEEWADEETVRYLSGTFSREHALDDESLEFYAPGHLLVDALVDDAMGPTDGRATVFARRLDGKHRGKVIAVIVVNCELDESYLGELEPPEGLVRRTHRRFWPESASAMVELDLRGGNDPRVVEDPDLVRRLEESYEGPEADQKIEYETFVRAIEDAARFRSTLREALDEGLENLREERDVLVQDAADRLEEDFELDLEYWRGVASEADDDDRVAEAERQIAMRESLVEGVRDYSMEVDAIALVVGGSPQSILH